MEVHLPGFNYAILWLILAVQLVVAGVVVTILHFWFKLGWKDILKGAALFVATAMAISGFAVWQIAGSWDKDLRINELRSLGYDYVAVNGDIWSGVENGAFYRGVFEQQGGEDSEVWRILVLPDAPL